MRNHAASIIKMTNMCKIQTSNIKIQNKSQLDKIQTSNIKIPNGTQAQTNKVYDIRERLFNFAKRTLQICKMLPKISGCDGIRKQLVNAGTAIGANYEEADGALTKKDFINKAGIARKEAKETRYWLKIISGTYIDERELAKDIKESEEIINILSAILKNSGYRIRT